MAKKTLGYILSIIGLASIALSFNQITSALKITLPSQLTSDILLIAGIAILVIGFFLIRKKGLSTLGQKAVEVPIYKGNQIIGYRRN